MLVADLVPWTVTSFTICLYVPGFLGPAEPLCFRFVCLSVRQTCHYPQAITHWQATERPNDLADRQTVFPLVLCPYEGFVYITMGMHWGNDLKCDILVYTNRLQCDRFWSLSVDFHDLSVLTESSRSNSGFPGILNSRTLGRNGLKLGGLVYPDDFQN